jgi:hypothetical protein
VSESDSRPASTDESLTLRSRVQAKVVAGDDKPSPPPPCPVPGVLNVGIIGLRSMGILQRQGVMGYNMGWRAGLAYGP